MEKTICADAGLSATDGALAQAYRDAVRTHEQDPTALDHLRTEQREWLRRRNACGDAACMRPLYQSRLAILQADGNPAPAEPIATAPTPAAKQTIQIDTPVGGWRNSQGEAQLYTQNVAYPASDVNVQEGQGDSAIIRGRILGATAEADKPRPYTLVVNGVALPLKTDNGEFARPYAFSPGANNVQILSPDGAASAKVQFFDAYREKTPAKIRVALSWDSDGTDLDLHVLTPDGGHAFYGHRVLDNGGALDVDVTTGYGPEIFTSPAALPGTYLVYVNYYGSYQENDITLATVTVVTQENTPDEKQQTFTAPMRHAGELTRVAAFVVR